jgi:hypothetical protein
VSGFGVPTSLPKTNYILKVEEYQWIWCITPWVTTSSYRWIYLCLQKLRNMSGFGVTTLLPKRNYIDKVEEYDWIWCNHLVTQIELYPQS